MILLTQGDERKNWIGSLKIFVFLLASEDTKQLLQIRRKRSEIEKPEIRNRRPANPKEKKEKKGGAKKKREKGKNPVSKSGGAVFTVLKFQPLFKKAGPLCVWFLLSRVLLLDTLSCSKRALNESLNNFLSPAQFSLLIFCFNALVT